MKIAISQPTYIPWLGYLELMDHVDLFVFLDNVQFVKQSWQNRNRIKTPAGLQWLTVPVVYRGRFGQRICDVEIRDASFVQQHLRAIELNYRRAAFFDRYFPELSIVMQAFERGGLLVEFNLALITWLQKVLGITTPVKRASCLPLEGRRTELLAKICRFFNAEIYLSPRGSADYLLDELSFFQEAQIEVKFQNYAHPEYLQCFPPFCGQASVLDLIFNEGPQSMNVIRHGRRDPLAPCEVRVARVPA
jgi:WbqC-like protein family